MIDREPLSSDLGDLRDGQDRPARKTITLHDLGSTTTNSVALLPPRVVAPVPHPRAASDPVTEVKAPRRVTPRTLGMIALFGSLAAMIVTAFGVTGVLMLIGLCVALRLMWTDRAGR
jgi:hypothetical protein